MSIPSEVAGNGSATIAKILVVEDDPINLLYLRSFLERSGFNVFSAVSGAEAEACVARSSPDLVLLDVMLPDADGFELCARLKAFPGMKEVPIIFLTGLDVALILDKALSAGAVDCVAKPYRGEFIVQKVHEHLASASTDRKTL